MTCIGIFCLGHQKSQISKIHIFAYGQIYNTLCNTQFRPEHHDHIAPKEHLRPTGMMFVRTYVRTYVRTCVRTSRWKILFTPYLVVELSPSAKIWCVYVTSINDGTQILTFLGIHNNHDFLNSRFSCGNLIILCPELHWFLFSDRFAIVAFLSRIVHS